MAARRRNLAAIDAWTPVHGLVGVAAGSLGLGLPLVLGVGIAYELAEQAFESSGAGQRFFATAGPESESNVAVDLGIYLAGYALGRYMRGRV